MISRIFPSYINSVIRHINKLQKQLIIYVNKLLNTVRETDVYEIMPTSDHILNNIAAIQYYFKYFFISFAYIVQYVLHLHSYTTFRKDIYKNFIYLFYYKNIRAFCWKCFRVSIALFLPRFILCLSCFFSFLNLLRNLLIVQTSFFLFFLLLIS